jgi:hypothetical protein
MRKRIEFGLLVLSQLFMFTSDNNINVNLFLTETH